MVVANFANTTKHGALSNEEQTYNVEYNNLDMIISIGYRKWASKILKNINKNLTFELSIIFLGEVFY